MPRGHAYVGKQFEPFDENKGFIPDHFMSFSPDDFPDTGLKLSKSGVVLSGPRSISNEKVEDKYCHWSDCFPEALTNIPNPAPPKEAASSDVVSDVEAVICFFKYVKKEIQAGEPPENAIGEAKKLPPAILKYITENPDSKTVLQQLEPLLHGAIGIPATELLTKNTDWLDVVLKKLKQDS
jgi:hypothetical protein